MDWWVFPLLLFGFAFLSALILPWINRSSIHRVSEELEELRAQNKALTDYLERRGFDLPPEAHTPEKLWPWQREQLAREAMQAQAMSIDSVSGGEVETPPEAPKVESIIESAIEKIEVIPAKSASFEQQFGARLPVWIGGVALALAGFFMVKYSIEIGLLSPTVRVVLGIIFGIGLLSAAEKVRSKPDFANGTRIAQALSGAGIADLYVCIFAATSLYGLIPPMLGFIGMAGVTFTAVVLSLRHGAPIAIMGLVGGLLTPALVSSNEPSAPLLFMYIYAVMTGFMIVIRHKAWWRIAVPTMLGGFAWISLWLGSGHFLSSDTFWLGLFLLATSATYVLLSPRTEQDLAFDPHYIRMAKWLNYLTLGGSSLMMALIVASSDYGLMAWGLFSLLSLGTIGLAYVDQERYGFTPWLAMVISLVMLASWNTPEMAVHAIILIDFAGLFIVSGYLMQSRSERPLLWSGLVIAGSLGFYLLAYAKLRGEGLFIDIPYFWGVLATITAAISALTVKRLMAEIPDDHPQKSHVLSIYAAQAAAFITIGLTIELDREFLSVAVALQVLAIAWINTHAIIPRMRWICAVIACVFGVLLIPQILLLMQLTAYSLTEVEWRLQAGIPIVDWPIFQLGVPALSFLGASYLLRQDRDDNIVRMLEVAAIALVGVMGYYLTRHAFHVSADVLFVKAGFFERGVITNILFLYGLSCIILGRVYERGMVGLSGLVLFGVAMFRLAYFDFIAYNPLWADQNVGSAPIFNVLLLTYGAPIIWMGMLMRELPQLGHTGLRKPISALMLLALFTLVNFEVRQLFQGATLDDGSATNAEIYSYSLAWLLLGVGLLGTGTARNDKMLRVASLLLMILTVGKVFLYDASELEGLYRVFSFFGLGLSLLGLSWFYTRFVFGTKQGS